MGAFRQLDPGRGRAAAVAAAAVGDGGVVGDPVFGAGGEGAADRQAPVSLGAQVCVGNPQVTPSSVSVVMVAAVLASGGVPDRQRLGQDAERLSHVQRPQRTEDGRR